MGGREGRAAAGPVGRAARPGAWRGCGAQQPVTRARPPAGRGPAVSLSPRPGRAAVARRRARGLRRAAVSRADRCGACGRGGRRRRAPVGDTRIRASRSESESSRHAPPPTAGPRPAPPTRIRASRRREDAPPAQTSRPRAAMILRLPQPPLLWLQAGPAAGRPKTRRRGFSTAVQPAGSRLAAAARALRRAKAAAVATTTA